MFKSLYAKLAIVLLGLFLAVTVAFLIIARFATDRYYQEITQRLNHPIAKHIAEDQPLIKEGKVNDIALKKLAHNAMVINPTVEVYLIDRQGEILDYALPPDAVKRTHVNLDAINHFLSGVGELPLVNDDPRSLTRQKIFSVAPVHHNDTLEGFVYVILGGSKYDQLSQSLRQSYILKLSLTALGASLLFTFLAGLTLFSRLTSRLRTLTTRVETFRQDNLLEESREISRHDKDEVEQLTDSFNTMAQRIVEQFERLKESDQIRRDLITNVSHDLRTPLASMQGYIETLLIKYDRLNDNERKNLLGVSRKHCLQLGRLISELFELAKLDSQSTKPNFEQFSITELLQDVSQEFQLVAEKKDISLQMNPQTTQTFVVADIGLIQRVLENLLENALRYTSAGGTVTITLVDLTSAVSVAVSDTGQGISDHEIPRIFDRFYRAGKKEEQRKESTGLGLAIVKKILDLHGSKITVESKVGEGTSFVFQLPAPENKAA